MIRKVLQILWAGILTVTLSACGTDNGTLKTYTASSEQKITLEVLNPKVEISTQFGQMVKEYEKENPGVKINLRTIGGGADHVSDLRARFTANNGPDIFPNSGYGAAKLWKKHLEDLSDQPWVKNTYDYALEPMRIDGKIYGMPMNLEGYGFIYNKDLFEKAGITTLPKTFSELKAAAKKLHEAGITPFAVGYSEQWILDHTLHIAFVRQKDPKAFIQGLSEGTKQIVGNKTFEDWVRLLDLTVQYGNESPLTTDYNTAVALFAAGKAAMIQQGNWIQPMIDQLSPHMNIGILPMPINDGPNDALVVGVPNNWAINKQSSPEKKKEAKKFLNWMISSEQGKKYMIEQFKFIPVFKNMETDNVGPLAKDVIRYFENKKTLPWIDINYPAGTKDLSIIVQAYIGKQLSRDQLLQELQKSWEKTEKK